MRGIPWATGVPSCCGVARMGGAGAAAVMGCRPGGRRVSGGVLDGGLAGAGPVLASVAAAVAGGAHEDCERALGDDDPDVELEVVLGEGVDRQPDRGGDAVQYGGGHVITLFVRWDGAERPGPAPRFRRPARRSKSGC